MTKPKTNNPARYWVHRTCSDCGKNVPPEDKDGLLVRIVMWRTAGKGGAMRKSRTQKYQCLACASNDPMWLKEPYVDSPGMEGIVKNAP